MTKQWQAGLIVALMALGPTAVWAQRYNTGNLDVNIVDDRGRTLREYPVRGESRGAVYKAYVEATRGRNYSVQVRNRSSERIGVVIAVDGRNIISGDRSNLSSSERMYVLGPYQQETYEGWRTGKDRVNRFYFTEEGDSYAGAWGDYSAMGVVAVAAFRENRPQQSWSQDGPGYGDQRGLRKPQSSAESAAPSAGAAPRMQSAPAPGTGYGETEYSPSRKVEFEAERQPFAKFLLKYAWRETLCRQGVIDCGDNPRPPRGNRLWDDNNDYTPPPPHSAPYQGESWR
ncbi:MAG: hypothetical protein LM550_14750 [Candidatus Contendobacter sp.]|nr:hypothetical protein [Candidatus Contendobacter sp.]